jgi:hypothetical protein
VASFPRIIGSVVIPTETTVALIVTEIIITLTAQ